MTAAPMSLTQAQASAQSLATGTAGAALLLIEQAMNGTGSWDSARARIRDAVAGPVDSGAHAGLYYGLPAIVFLLHTAAQGGQTIYRRAADNLDTALLRLAGQRVTTATARIRRGEAAAFAEYDLFYGLTGIATLLLHRRPSSGVLGDILTHLVELTRPRRDQGGLLPGWWVDHHPDPTLPTPGGHANFGMAHGTAGLLALLALAAGRGLTVDGQHEAIERLLAWFDTWQQDTPHGPWWPQWITREQLATGRPAQPGPGRPSWCYGAVGIARALQLAGIATSNPTRQTAAEEALAACLTERQLDRLTEPGLCHGAAGVYQTAHRAAQDSTSPAIQQQLPAVAARLAGLTQSGAGAGRGLLTGDTGVSLAMATAEQGPPQSGWDTCLLIT